MKNVYCHDLATLEQTLKDMKERPEDYPGWRLKSKLNSAKAKKLRKVLHDGPSKVFYERSLEPPESLLVIPTGGFRGYTKKIADIQKASRDAGLTRPANAEELGKMRRNEMPGLLTYPPEDLRSALMSEEPIAFKAVAPDNRS